MMCSMHHSFQDGYNEFLQEAVTFANRWFVEYFIVLLHFSRYVLDFISYRF